MTLRRIQLSAVAVVLFTCFFASGAAHDAAIRSNPTKTISATPPVANWTFSGCWTQFSSQPCRDIFVDQAGQHYICKECGTTGKPGPGNVLWKGPSGYSKTNLMELPERCP
jgi:hypothetical protein